MGPKPAELGAHGPWPTARLLVALHARLWAVWRHPTRAVRPRAKAAGAAIEVQEA
jgi:hypothetical protein